MSFDPVKEKYIVEKLDELSHSRKLGYLMADVMRVLFDQPSMFRSEAEMQQILGRISAYGLSDRANSFYEQKNKEVKEMKDKIDAIYSMVLELYTLVKFGKRLGIEKRVENCARAEYLIERDMLKLLNGLGLSMGSSPFESAKIDTVQRKADDVLEYIIQSYDGIVKEIEASVKPVTVEVPNIQVTEKAVSVVASAQVSEKTDSEVKAEQNTEKPGLSSQDNKSNADENSEETKDNKNKSNMNMSIFGKSGDEVVDFGTDSTGPVGGAAAMIRMFTSD